MINDRNYTISGMQTQYTQTINYRPKIKMLSMRIKKRNKYNHNNTIHNKKNIIYILISLDYFFEIINFSYICSFYFLYIEMKIKLHIHVTKEKYH